MNLLWKVAIIIHKSTKRLSMWIIPPFLAARVLVVIVRNDCFQMLLIVCSPLPPTLSCAAWTVWLRCVFNWLPGEAEATEDDRPTHHFLSLCVLVFCFAGWGIHSIKIFSQVTLKTSNYFRDTRGLFCIYWMDEEKSVILLRPCCLSTSAEHSYSARRTKHMWPRAL